ncbi:MAG: hypothetical protein FWE24_05630 [Defluviitaleaceae bacterium]|nr:hypothetical protein [Defluviitaleaceae bacterium]
MAMVFELYKDVKAFNDDVYDLLMENEVVNMMILGDLAVGLTAENPIGWRDASKWMMAAVKDSDCAVAAVFMIPGDNLQFYISNRFGRQDLVLAHLAKGLADTEVFIKGIYVKADLGPAFADAYVFYVNTWHKKKCERLYTLSNCISADILLQGHLRLAAEKDLAFIPYWREDFLGNKNISDDYEGYRGMISAKNLYILEDEGIPVSMGRIDQKLENICGLGLIYTPSYFRSKGYGTAITAHISKLCLDEGCTCALIADLANPVSNSIYQKIGYKPVCDMIEIGFDIDKN